MKLKERVKSKKSTIKQKKNNLISLDDFIDKNYGKKGSEKRNAFDAGYENFKLGAMIQDARLAKGLTQEELAEKIGSTKSYISRIENDIKEVRLSTLQKIVHKGLGGQLNVFIRL